MLSHFLMMKVVAAYLCLRINSPGVHCLRLQPHGQTVLPADELDGLEQRPVLQLQWLRFVPLILHAVEPPIHFLRMEFLKIGQRFGGAESFRNEKRCAVRGWSQTQAMRPQQQGIVR